MIGRSWRISVAAAAVLISLALAPREARAAGSVASKQVIPGAGDAAPVSAVVWVDADTIVTGGHDRSVRVWRRASGSFVAGEVFRSHRGIVQALAARPGGAPALIASGSQDGTARAVRPPSGFAATTGRPVARLAYDPAGPRFAAALDDGSIKAFDATAPATPGVALSMAGIAAPSTAADALAILGNRAAAGFDGGLILYWPDVTAGGGPLAIRAVSEVKALAFAADNRLISGHADGVARRWDLGLPALPAPAQRTLAVALPFALDPASGRVAGLKDAAHPNQVTLYQADGTTAASPIDAGAPVKGLVLAGDAMVVDFADTTVKVYQPSAPAASPKSISIAPQKSKAIAATPDGATVLVAEDDKSLASFDVASSTTAIAKVKFAQAIVGLRAATSDAGLLAASVMDDGSAGIGLLKVVAPVILPGPASMAGSIALSPSLKTCAVGYANGEIRVFTIATTPAAMGNPASVAATPSMTLAPSGGFSGPPADLAVVDGVGADARTMLAVARGAALELWHVERGAMLQVVPQAGNVAVAVARGGDPDAPAPADQIFTIAALSRGTTSVGLVAGQPSAIRALNNLDSPPGSGIGGMATAGKRLIFARGHALASVDAENSKGDLPVAAGDLLPADLVGIAGLDASTIVTATAAAVQTWTIASGGAPTLGVEFLDPALAARGLAVGGNRVVVARGDGYAHVLDAGLAPLLRLRDENGGPGLAPAAPLVAMQTVLVTATANNASPTDARLKRWSLEAIDVGPIGTNGGDPPLGEVYALAWSDPNRLFSAGRDGTLRLSTATAPFGLAVPPTAPSSATPLPRLFAVAASPTLLAAGGQDLTFRRWSINSGTGLPETPVASDPRPAGSLSAIALLGDGRVVTAGLDPKIRLWQPNMTTGVLNGTEFPAPAPAAEVRALAVANIGGADHVASIGLDGQLVVWKIPAIGSADAIAPAAPVVSLTAGPAQGLAVAWSPDGSTIAVARSDARIELFTFTP